MLATLLVASLGVRGGEYGLLGWTESANASGAGELLLARGDMLGVDSSSGGSSKAASSTSASVEEFLQALLALAERIGGNETDGRSSSSFRRMGKGGMQSRWTIVSP